MVQRSRPGPLAGFLVNCQSIGNPEGVEMDEGHSEVVGKQRFGMMEPSVKTAGKEACWKGKETPPNLEVGVWKHVLPSLEG